MPPTLLARADEVIDDFAEAGGLMSLRRKSG
jgi:hypothetical protein